MKVTLACLQCVCIPPSFFLTTCKSYIIYWSRGALHLLHNLRQLQKDLPSLFINSSMSFNSCWARSDREGTTAGTSSAAVSSPARLPSEDPSEVESACKGGEQGSHFHNQDSTLILIARQNFFLVVKDENR